MAAPLTSTRRLSVAPMMDWTDRHCRYFHRLISPRALLYTEMIPTGAILRGDRARHLDFDPAEHPVALQLGGADPAELARAAAVGEAFGYDEIDLNVGCPSDRVQNARFGACLMAEPALVAACVRAMRGAVDLPVTVKTRIGIDHQDDPAFLHRLVAAVAEAGCAAVIIHARKAWLSGLSPKQNRELPPLRHERVHGIKQAFPGLEVIVNGGLRSVDQIRAQLAEVDGVMIGRAAYHDPFALATWERAIFGSRRGDGPNGGRPGDGGVAWGESRPEARVADRLGRAGEIAARVDVIHRLLPYVEARCAEGVPLQAITRHILGLFAGLPGARAWRRHLSEHAHRPGAGPEVIEAAARRVGAAAERLEGAEVVV